MECFASHMACSLKSAQTWSYGWKESKSRILGLTRVARLNTNLAGARSRMRTAVLGIELKMDASSWVGLAVGVPRMPPLVRHRTSFCSGRPGLHIASPQSLFVVSPLFVGYCGGFWVSPRVQNEAYADYQSFVRHVGGDVWCACVQTCW